MKIVGVDIDGVLADFTKGARTLCKGLFGKPDDSLIQTTWTFGSLGITPEEENIMWRALDSIPNWWMKLETLPHTYMLEQVINERHRVAFITNRKDGAGQPVDLQSAIWLKEKYNLRHANVVISDDKGPVAKGLKLDYYIDDRPKNVAEVVQTYPRCQTFLLDATYNQEFSYPHRVKSFNEFAKIILET